jgi:hypothetical protein
MRYIPKDYEAEARRLVDFETCGNIDASGSVKGMQTLYGWPKRGQVRLGGYIYNVGPSSVQRLEAAGLVRQ